MTTINNNQKFLDGNEARNIWAKQIIEQNPLLIDTFNNICGGVFFKTGQIVLDDSYRQTTIKVIPTNKNIWKEKNEKIYIFTRNGDIMKIGGTRTSMKDRFSSYLCGHHVRERGKSGKMSVTNAYLYHTIEADLLEKDSIWEIYSWKLPINQYTINILGIDTIITSQTYHAYESRCINEYKKITNRLPFLCDNCDPNY